MLRPFVTSLLRRSSLALAVAAISSMPAGAQEGELVPLDILVEQLGGRDFSALQASLQKDLLTISRDAAGSGKIDLDGAEVELRTLLALTLEKLPTDFLTSSDWSAKNADFIDWLFGDATLLAMVCSEIRPQDKGEEVLKIWSQLWSAEPNAGFRTKYAPLSFALAVIYDDPRMQPKAKEQEYHPTLTLDERYAFFRDASEGGKLKTSCDRLSVRSLVRIVDLNVSREELAWAQKNGAGSAKKTGGLYDEIDYLMERAVDGNFSPYASYTLSEIRKHGGICGDQAHYASNVARANGIPAAVVVGTGNRGAHAWIAFSPDANEWAYHASQGITNGYARCSQTGRRMLTTEFEREDSRDYRPENRTQVLRRVLLAKAAAGAGENEVALRVVEAAGRYGELNTEPYQLRTRLMKTLSVPEEKWSDYVANLERTFRDYPAMQEIALDIKIRHMFAKLPEEEQTKLLEREVRRVARKVGSEGSALIDVVDRVGGIMVEEDPVQAGAALTALYKRSFRKYGEDLELFGKLMGSFERRAAKVPSLKKELPGIIYAAYKRTAESNSKEYFRAEMEQNLLRRIIALYRKAGGAENLEKATSLQKGYDRRKEKIEKAAL